MLNVGALNQLALNAVSPDLDPVSTGTWSGSSSLTVTGSIRQTSQIDWDAPGTFSAVGGIRQNSTLTCVATGAFELLRSAAPSYIQFTAESTFTGVGRVRRFSTLTTSATGTLLMIKGSKLHSTTGDWVATSSTNFMYSAGALPLAIGGRTFTRPGQTRVFIRPAD